MTYPTYHRKGTRCLKRESDTTAIEVQIPGEGKRLPTVHHPVTFPDKDRLDQEVAKMQKVESDVYEDYLATFFQATDLNRKELNKIRQERYDNLYSKTNSIMRP